MKIHQSQRKPSKMMATSRAGASEPGEKRPQTHSHPTICWPTHLLARETLANHFRVLVHPHLRSGGQCTHGCGDGCARCATRRDQTPRNERMQHGTTYVGKVPGNCELPYRSLIRTLDMAATRSVLYLVSTLFTIVGVVRILFPSYVRRSQCGL